VLLHCVPPCPCVIMASDAPPVYEPVEKEEDQEIVIDLEDNNVSEALPADPDMIKISVTDGATVIATFDASAPPELSIRDLRAALSQELAKIDTEKRIRLLIFRGQILKDEQHVSDTKIVPGDTLQMLTCANTPPPEVAPVDTAPPAASGSPRAQSARALLMQLGVIQQNQQQMHTHHRGMDPGMAQISLHGLELQEEVERWASRVKVWTCMLLLLYSFKLLVGLSQQSLENQRENSTPTLAFSLLGFWVAYVGARAATRLNLALARGYLYGQVLVAVVNIFLLAMRDPNQVASGAHGEEVPYSILWISLAINCLFWGYIVYGAYRFQRALFMWLSEVHPDLILEDHSDM